MGRFKEKYRDIAETILHSETEDSEKQLCATLLLAALVADIGDCLAGPQKLELSETQAKELEKLMNGMVVE